VDPVPTGDRAGERADRRRRDPRPRRVRGLVHPDAARHSDLGHGTGSLAPSGVDQEAGILLGYDDGRTGALTIPIRNQSPGSARIFGSAGWIDVVPRLHHPTTIEVTGCLRAGRTESAVMPLQDTLDVQAILEEAGRQLGVTYSEDSSQ